MARNVFIVSASQVITSDAHPEGLYSTVSGFPKTFDGEEADALNLYDPGAGTKNLFLRDHKKQNYYLLTVRDHLQVRIKDFQKNELGKPVAILSRREAQERCMNEYIASLVPGDVIDARITRLDSFGAFADIGCGIVSLIPIDSISVSRIDHPKERFTVGMEIKAVVKAFDNGRISLTHKELLGTWEENVSRFEIGETVAGIIRSVEEYGAFVELAPNLAGLAEMKDGIRAGQQASVYIKNIIPSRMKIKLIIIDTFDYELRPEPPEYFFYGSHMDRFVYSPSASDKMIQTEFQTMINSPTF